MTLQDIIDNIDKSSSEEWQDLEQLAKEFDIFDYVGDYDLKVKSYFYETWYCTDTWVGGRIYFYDDEPICVSYQQGRKCGEKFSWLNQEAFDKTHKYILSLIEDNNQLRPTIITNDELTNEDVYGNGYHIEFASQFTKKIDKVILKETLMPVKIIDTYHKNTIGKKLLIEDVEGNTKVVGTDEVTIPYLLEPLF